MAFPTGWGRRQKIEINLNKIDSDLTSYTALLTRDAFSDEIVSPTDSNAAQADGGDVRFSSDAAGSSLIDHDLILWEQDSVDGGGDAIVLVAVEVGSVASSGANTSFYVWYKTAGTDTAPDGTLAYDASWYGFWPLISDVNNRTGSANLTNVGTVTIGGATGIQSIPITTLNGVDQLLQITTAGITSPPCTQMYWGTAEVPDLFQTGIHIGHSTRDGLGNITTGSGVPTLGYNNTYSVSGLAGVHNVQANTLSHWAGTVTTTTATLFWNGAEVGTAGPYSTSAVTVNNVWIGAQSIFGGARWWDGNIGLAQVHLADRGAAWVKAAYEEMADPANYWVAGAPSAPLSGPPVNTVAPMISKVV